jgi:putative ABC transport system permease protein
LGEGGSGGMGKTLQTLRLVHRSLAYYWRTNMAVVAGVAIAVAVLAGALLVGESVRASLRELAVGRLGRTDHLIASTQFFRQALVGDLLGTPAFKSCCSSAYGLIAVDGLVTSGESGADGGERRAGGVAIYGIDDGFWKFHSRPSPGTLRPRDAWVSPALARELGLTFGATGSAAGAGAGDSGARSVLVRLQQPTAVPLGTLHGRRDEAGKTIRVTVRNVVSRESMGEFSLRPSQGDVRAIFLPLARLQTDLNQPDKVNAVLVSVSARTGAGAGAGADADASAAASGDSEAAAKAARSLEVALEKSIQLEDAGLKTRGLPLRGATSPGFVVESDNSIVSDAQAEIVLKAAKAQGLQTTPVLSYLAYSIRSGDREIPYSVVAAADVVKRSKSEPASSGGAPPIWLNAWAAEQLQAKPGAPVTIAYDVWDDAGGLVRRDATFTVAGVLPMIGAGADASLTPEYPGITGQESLSDWDPPFPLDLSRITPRDEEYWATYRAAPKAIVTLADGQRLWGSRYGRLTSIRLYRNAFYDGPFTWSPGGAHEQPSAVQASLAAAPVRAATGCPAGAAASSTAAAAAAANRAAAPAVPAAGRPPETSTVPDCGMVETSYLDALNSLLTPAAAGFIVQPVRATALAASSGVTDFGEYFLYFSFFIVVSGLLLAGLFFRLGVEQRLREVGLLSAIGYTPALVRRLFLIEGLYLAIAGSAIGVAGAIGYAAAIMLGLRTWWVGAVGTTALTLQPSATSLLIGAAGGIVTAVLAIAWTLRGVTRVSARTLLHGDVQEIQSQSADAATGGKPARTAGRRRTVFVIFVVLAITSTAASAAGVMNATAGFFGAGGAALIAALIGLSLWLRRAPAVPAPSPTGRGLWRFGQVNAAARPGRTVLSVALIAFATFVIVTVGAFRQEGVASADDPKSGTGGYALIAESIAPLTEDPNSAAGRASLGLDSPDLQPVLSNIVSIARFRLRPGDDGSCLNLYRPENPRVIAPTSEFVQKGGRFTFAGMMADANDAERANPWLLLNRRFDDGATPVIVDQTSLMYVFHRAIGDDIEIRSGGGGGAPIKLRVVGSLSHSVFQSELIVGEPSFVRLFPGNEGYRLFLVQTGAGGGAGSGARAEQVARTLENRLADFGVEAIATVDRLRAYQQVENTYLSTFQALGALGLVLGTFGVGTVLLRNILERRRELALLQAIGYRESHIRSLILAESVSLVVWGLLAGAACALLAVLPAIVERGGSFPWTAVVMLLAAVLAAGFISSIAATAMAIRLPLLASLRAE